MKKAKTSALFICIAMIASMVMSGCGNKPGDASSSSTNVSSGSGESQEAVIPGSEKYEKGDYTLPISKEGVTLRWMGRDSEAAGTSFLTNKSLIWDEAQKQTGITIEWDVIPNAEYAEVMAVRLSSHQNLPDIIALQGQADGSFLAKYYDEEAITSLTPLIEDYAPNIKKVFEEYPGYKKALTLPDGAVAALGELNGSSYRAKGITIRQDWLDKLNLESPTNMDELYDVAKAFVENDPNGNGKKDEFGIQASNVRELRQLGMGFGLSLVSGSGWSMHDGELVYEFISPEYKEFLTWMNRAYNDGVLPSDVQSAGGDICSQRQMNNTLGIVGRESIHSMVEKNNPEGTLKKNVPDAVWRTVDFVEDETHKLAIPTEPLATIWRSYGITTACQDQVAAIRFLDFMFAGEGRILNTSGIEGVTYNMVNGVVVPIANWQANVEAGVFLGDGYAPKMITDVTALGFKETPYLNEDEELKKWTLDILDSVQSKTYQPFQPSIPSLEDAKELSKIFADLKTYIDEMYIKFLTGETSLDEYDTYVENCKSLGCDTAKEIYEKGLAAAE